MAHSDCMIEQSGAGGHEVRANTHMLGASGEWASPAGGSLGLWQHCKVKYPLLGGGVRK